MNEKICYLSLLLCLYVIRAHGLACAKNICYGSMQEIAQLSTNAPTHFYVRPDNHTSCLPGDCLAKLIAGQRLDCINNTLSRLTADKPWHLVTNLHLKPSCKERQTLLRQSLPYVDFALIDVQMATNAAALTGHSPCSILKLDNVNVSVEYFLLDNKPCTQAVKGDFPLWFHAAVSLLTTKPNMDNIHINNLVGTSSSVMIHLGSQRSRGHPVELNNLDISYITNGSIQMDSVRGRAVLRNLERVIQNFPPDPSNHFVYENVSSILNIYSFYGFDQILDTGKRTGIYPCSKDSGERCSINTLYAVSLPIFLALLLVGTCLWMCCRQDSRHKQQVEHEKTTH